MANLSHIHGECEKIYSMLKQNSLVGGVRWIHGSEETKKSFAEYVMDVLLSKSWDLVHYAGHSHFEGDSGYLFFPPKESGDLPEKVRIGNFAANLVPHTKLLYLSSCQSSEDSFVMALARSKIPAAVGFRWQVDDAHASEYALSFIVICLAMTTSACSTQLCVLARICMNTALNRSEFGSCRYC